MRIIVWPLGLLLFAVAAPGPHPVDFLAVREYARTRASEAASFDAIAANYYQSCPRTRDCSRPAGVGDQPFTEQTTGRHTPIPSPRSRSISKGGTPAQNCDISRIGISSVYLW